MDTAWTSILLVGVCNWRVDPAQQQVLLPILPVRMVDDTLVGLHFIPTWNQMAELNDAVFDLLFPTLLTP